MPMDPDPVEGGNLIVTGDVVLGRHPGQLTRVVEVVDPQAAQLPLMDALAPRYVSNFVNCPQADDWRRRD
jgi:hypothetical protein